MDNKNIFKKKALYFLFGSLFVILAALFLHSSNHLFQSHEKTTRIFQERILAKEKKLDRLMAEMSESILGIDSAIVFENLYEIFRKEEIRDVSLFVFENDQLIFWSDNTIQVNRNRVLNPFDGPSVQVSNGIFDIRKLSVGNTWLYGLIQVKRTYPYENEHLSNNFASFLGVSQEIDLTEEESDYPIRNSEGAFMFSLDFTNATGTNQLLDLVLALLFLLAFSLLIASVYYGYKLMSLEFSNKFLLLLAFIFDLFLLRFLLLYFKLPDFIFNTAVFGPELYASSWLAPSLGDLLLNLITLFGITYAFFHSIKIKKPEPSKAMGWNRVFAVLGLVAVFLSYLLLVHSLRNTVIHSSISFNLADITSISVYSMLGFFGFSMCMFVFYMFSFKLILFFFESVTNTLARFMVPLLLLSSLGLTAMSLEFDLRFLLFLFLYLLLVYYVVFNRKRNVRFTSTVLLILLFSWLSTFILNSSSAYKEQADRMLLAQTLIPQKDPITEYSFAQAREKLLQDNYLQDQVSGFPYPDNEEYSRIIEYIYATYFSTFKSNTEIWLTLCDSLISINVNTQGDTANCHNFFDQAIENFGEQTDYTNLYFIDNLNEEDNYLGIIEFPYANHRLCLFVEIFNIYSTSKIGYPELLVDNRQGAGLKLADYAYGMYEEGVQIHQYGNFPYALNLALYKPASDQPIQSFNQNGYDHLLYMPDKKNAIIVSTKTRGFIDIIAPFSYTSIFLGVLTFLFLLIFRGPGKMQFSLLGFKKRLQLSVTAIIIVSFLLVGIGSTMYIVSINKNKNTSILREKTRSVLIELKHKLEDQESLDRDMEVFLENYLLKFSQVFFTDLNLYDLDGQLLATSRKAIFRKNLVSEMMDPTAFLNLHSQHKSLFLHEEKIGEYRYLSAYVPLRNADSRLIAYLNLPYFAKQDELTSEVSTFLVAFINVYVILIAFSIYLALVVSNYITKPLELIRERIGKLKLGKKEAKIEWHRQDEIGSLVAEYNRMVDELAMSAERLAKSERESAWREMAKQIAHEIKNPLTPMKLSVQYLQKAWDEQAPDWDERLHKFSNTIIEQINSLSIIATEFSDFAKMPRSRFETINLTNIIQNSIGIFKQSSSIRFEFDPPGPCYVNADKEQLLRVFNNLIKNSIQAIDDPDKGVVEVRVEQQENDYQIRIRDNGKGIPIDMQEKVFYPNFTTKSGGMGLGLAMVKNIIENARGEITFESQESVGTTFYILLPKANRGGE